MYIRDLKKDVLNLKKELLNSAKEIKSYRQSLEEGAENISSLNKEIEQYKEEFAKTDPSAVKIETPYDYINAILKGDLTLDEQNGSV